MDVKTILRSSVSSLAVSRSDLQDVGVTEYNIDDCWEVAPELKAEYNLSIGDAYAIAAAKALDTDGGRNVTLLVGADNDYNVFEEDKGFQHLIERFRDEPA